MVRTRRLSILTLVASIAVLLGGCASEVVTPPTVTTTAAPEEHRNAVPSPPDDPMPDAIWPLTGLDAAGAAEADLLRPAIGVKIENTARGRPQKGLEYADIVFEEYINLNCTRLIAFFQSNSPEHVGPIRSARDTDPNIIGSFNTALVASGTNHGVELSWPADQPFIDNDVLKSQGPFIHSDEGFQRMERSDVDKDAEFRLWGHPSILAADAVELGIGPTTRQFDYAYPAETMTAAVKGNPVGTIDIWFSSCANPHWVWDPAKGGWQRFEFDSPHKSLDGIQITAANVIILQVVIDYPPSNRENPESTVIVDSPQPGFIATDGKIMPILWSKADRRDKFHLTTLDGELVSLAPGNTWVELVPLSGGHTAAVIKFDGVAQ